MFFAFECLTLSVKMDKLFFVIIFVFFTFQGAHCDTLLDEFSTTLLHNLGQRLKERIQSNPFELNDVFRNSFLESDEETKK
jgi:hypothetical protein